MNLPIPDLVPLAGPLPIRHARVDMAAWAGIAREVASQGGRLVALWGSRPSGENPSPTVCVAYGLPEGLAWLEMALSPERPVCPDLGAIFPVALRMQRAMTDLESIAIQDAQDSRPWLDHGVWADRPSSPADPYAFVRVEGEGVHEIPVGPVHAGIIEPGHFRFSVVGEKILRLEARLGYTHKGVEQRFRELSPHEAHRLAGRVSGDSTVAHAWAYCMALESAAGGAIPPRAQWIRALLLERERVANHLGDLGALGNDAGLAFGLAQFSRLREDWVRHSGSLFGHRLLMDCVLPGGVACEVTPATRKTFQREAAALAQEVGQLRRIYDEHSGLQDRFIGTGRVTPDLALQLGLTGLAGRASGVARDLRCHPSWAPYDQLAVRMAGHRNGDVAARVSVRFDELFESLRLTERLLETLPEGSLLSPLPALIPGTRGAGWVEGWRGEVFLALELGGTSDHPRIRRCHCHDPSWQNWPVLEHAVMGNIVPDFPLINKSFNLSYSGHDL